MVWGTCSRAHAQLQYDAPAGWKAGLKPEGVVYTSPTLLKDLGAIIITAPEAWQGGSLADFLKSKMRGQNGRSNTSLADNLQIQPIDSRNVQGTSFSDTGQIRMRVLVSAHALKDGRVQRLTAMWADNAEAAANVKPVAEKIVRQLAASNRGGAIGKTQPHPTVRTGRTIRQPQPVTTGGIPAGGAIQSVSLVGTYQSGVGGYVYYVFDPYIFYKNGIVLRDFEAPPAEIDVAAFSRQNPHDWGKWRRSGAETLIYWNGARDGKPFHVDTKDIQPAIPGRRGLRLSGKYSSLSGGGNTAFGGDVTVFSSRDLIFAPDGRFATRSAGGGGSSTVTALSTSPTESGTYAIDGYSITLKFRNGQTVRKAFVIFGSGKGKPVDNSVIHIGGRTYTRDD